MSPSSEFLHGASSSSTPFRFRHGSSGEFSDEEDTTWKKKVTSEPQHMKWMEEGTPLQFQHNNLGSTKEEYVTMEGRKEEEYVTIQVEPGAPQMQGLAAQISCSHSWPIDESESGSSIMSYAVLVANMARPANPTHIRPAKDMGRSQMGWIRISLFTPQDPYVTRKKIILLVPAVILGLDLFGVI